MDSYCIKSGYVARSRANTKVEDITQYWNDSRIEHAGLYQWDVYRLAAEYISARAVRNAKLTVADVGCGYPYKAEHFLAAAGCELTLFDQPSMAPFMAERFPNFDFVPVDLEKGLGGYEQRFDCVVCADVIEHLMDPNPLVELLKGLVTPEGYLFISTPERDAARGVDCTTSDHPEHVREWNLAEFRDYLQRCGLEVVRQQQLPVKRLGKLAQWLAPVLKDLNPARYKSCQLAVCQLQ